MPKPGNYVKNPSGKGFVLYETTNNYKREEQKRFNEMQKGKLESLSPLHKNLGLAHATKEEWNVAKANEAAWLGKAVRKSRKHRKSRKASRKGRKATRRSSK